ncbi:MAG: hypothetical protein AB1648_09850 [Pseudomonadota bacterium]
MRLVAYLLAGSAAELAEIAARIEDAPAPATACPGLHPGEAAARTLEFEAGQGGQRHA